MPFFIALDLQGGLGNILFQVAAGLALAYRHGCRLLLARTQFHHMTNYDYQYFLREIEWMPAGAGALPPETLEYTPEADIKLGTTYDSVFPPLDTAIQKAKTEDRPIRIINGFFQSEAYFGAIAPAVRNHFVVPEDIADMIRAKYAHIDLSQTAFIHIRRGDYVGTGFDMSLEKCYFVRAIQRMEDHTTPLFYFIFSDNPVYAERLPAIQALKTRAVLIPESNETIALWIMSMCALGGICSNSTFSWWGGYLNPNPNKLVIWPKEWHADKYAYAGMIPISVISVSE